MKLDWLRKELGDHSYSGAQMDGWLCPTIFRYFEVAPSSIYCKAEAAGCRNHQ